MKYFITPKTSNIPQIHTNNFDLFGYKKRDVKRTVTKYKIK